MNKQDVFEVFRRFPATGARSRPIDACDRFADWLSARWGVLTIEGLSVLMAVGAVLCYQCADTVHPRPASERERAVEQQARHANGHTGATRR
jgi:hypothetical protein